MITVKTFSPPPPDFNEILRYMACKQGDDRLFELIENCVSECLPSLSYKVCYDVFPISVSGSKVRFPFAEFDSASLGRHLGSCTDAVTFAATVGIELDRLITKYGRLSPGKALVFQAIGAERIEALCDDFCNSLKEDYKTVLPRFSAGYGDFSLDAQKELFRVLDCSRKIGLSLNSALLMSPSKSVTAIVGVNKKGV